MNRLKQARSVVVVFGVAVIVYMGWFSDVSKRISARGQEVQDRVAYEYGLMGRDTIISQQEGQEWERLKNPAFREKLSQLRGVLARAPQGTLIEFLDSRIGEPHQEGMSITLKMCSVTPMAACDYDQYYILRRFDDLTLSYVRQIIFPPTFDSTPAEIAMYQWHKARWEATESWYLKPR